MKLKIGKLKQDSELSVITPAPIQLDKPIPTQTVPQDFINTKQGIKVVQNLEVFIAAIKSILIRT